MQSLKGRIVFITGASAGIGEACAWAFAAEGARLVLAARRLERLHTLGKELTKAHKTAVFIGNLDVRDREAVNAFVESLPPDFAEIDILVNNAGLARGTQPIPEGLPEDWNEMIDTNIKGLLWVTRAVVPGMIARGRGQIINLGSIAGRQTYPKGGVYCSTKFAERSISQGLMMDLLETPLRVSTVDPGLVETEFSLVRHRGNAESAAKTYAGAGSLHAEDVAEAVVFCATRHPRANIAELVVLPTTQASVYHLDRREVGK